MYLYRIMKISAICLLFITFPSVADSFQPSTLFQPTTSPLHYATDDHEFANNEPLEVNASPMVGSEPIILKINSLDDLQCLLEEDEDRMVAIKFYAPWCKTCQRLGIDFGRLARKWGDVVSNGNFVQGRIRCAEVEFKSVEASRWVTEELRVKAIPTLQLYSGTSKMWEGIGAKNTKMLQDELRRLEHMPLDDLRAHGELVDDGILEQALEDSFYDVPDFLNEEW